MKTKKWQAMVMIAFAWVLWERNSQTTVKWTPLNGYSTKDEFNSAQTTNMRLWLGKKGYTSADNTRVYSEGGHVLNFPCLPATNIDPRPRK